MCDPQILIKYVSLDVGEIAYKVNKNKTKCQHVRTKYMFTLPSGNRITRPYLVKRTDNMITYLSLIIQHLTFITEGRD